MSKFKVCVSGRVYIDRATVIAQLDEMLMRYAAYEDLARELSAYVIILDSENADHYGEVR